MTKTEVIAIIAKLILIPLYHDLSPDGAQDNDIYITNMTKINKINID